MTDFAIAHASLPTGDREAKHKADGPPQLKTVNIALPLLIAAPRTYGSGNPT